MSNLKAGDKVRCTGNRGLEYHFKSDKVYTIQEVYGCFGHVYVTVTSEHRVLRNVRAHRFTKVEVEQS